MKNIFLSLACFATLSLHAQLSFIDKTNQSYLGGNDVQHGLAIADYDGDGLDDIYVPVISGDYSKLFRNLGNGIFQNYAAIAGVFTTGHARTAAWADIDNDGDPDLYVGNTEEQDQLYINHGDGTFTEAAALHGIDNPGNTTSVNFADVNNDGWLDIYVARIGDKNQLYINDGNANFTEHGSYAGVDSSKVSMGAVFFDYDLDGDVDLFQVYDGFQYYNLFRNRGDGTFDNVTVEAGVLVAAFGMGAEVADMDNNGYPDIYITNLFDNILFANNGDGTFTSIYGVHDPGMGKGSVFADFDNDGLRDLYVSNDTYFAPQDNVMYWNKPGYGFFDLQGGVWDSPFAGYATVSADLDDDGKMDILICNSGEPGVQFLQNTTENENHFIAFQLEGVQSNRDAIGARMEIHTSAGIQYDQVIGNSGYAGQNGKWMHFGLGDIDHIDQAIFHWPSGVVDEIGSLAADEKYYAKEGLGIVTATHPVKPTVTSCVLVADQQGYHIVLPKADQIRALHVFNMVGQRIPCQPVQSEQYIHFVLPEVSSGIYNVEVLQGDAVYVARLFRN
jgi:hypothetical protein